MSSDGTGNVRNFNISPTKCIKNSTTDSKTNMKIREACSCRKFYIKIGKKFLLFFLPPNFLSATTHQLEEEATYLFRPSSAYRPVSDLKAKHQKRSKYLSNIYQTRPRHKWQRSKNTCNLQQPNRS